MKDLSTEELLDLLWDGALNRLAPDGLWFRAVEDRFGLEAAMNLDREAWRSFTVIEAKRIMKRLGISPGGGIPALVRALGYRLYARISTSRRSSPPSRRSWTSGLLDEICRFDAVAGDAIILVS